MDFVVFYYFNPYCVLDWLIIPLSTMSIKGIAFESYLEIWKYKDNQRGSIQSISMIILIFPKNSNSTSMWRP